MSQITLLNLSRANNTTSSDIAQQLAIAFDAFDIRILDAQLVNSELCVLLEHTQADITAIIMPILEASGLTITEPETTNKATSSTHNALASKQYVLTYLCDNVSAHNLVLLRKLIASNNLDIQNIKRLDNATDQALNKPTCWLESRCLELVVTGELTDIDTLRAQLLEFASAHSVDINIQTLTDPRQSYRLACFDMDSTLIKAEVIDELAKHAGIGDQVAEITERAMQGELDFNQSFTQRMALLKGLSEHVLEKVANELTLMDGLATLLRNLKNKGYKTAILSGGFNYFGEFLQSKFGFDYVYANTLEIENGLLTGRAIAPIVNADRKALLLKKIAEKHDIPLEQTIAVGDGANDLEMLATAGLGIAFRAKPLVRESAKHSLSVHGLDSILYLLGYHDDEIERS